MEVDEEEEWKVDPKKGPLHNLFFGKLKREVYREKVQGEGDFVCSNEQSEEFLSIFLNPVNSNDFYGAWDDEFNSVAEVETEGLA